MEIRLGNYQILVQLGASEQRFLLNARVDKSGSALCTGMTNWMAEMKR